MKKAEAEKEIQRRNSQTYQYCPLTNTICRVDCVAFLKASMANFNDKQDEDWSVRGGYCNAYIFFGPQG